jgi:uncharacterized PurR-regulated membrane protein YhhQ (DUF165 family)
VTTAEESLPVKPGIRWPTAYGLVLAIHAIGVVMYFVVTSFRFDGCNSSDNDFGALVNATAYDVVFTLALIIASRRFGGPATRKRVAVAWAATLPLAIGLLWLGIAHANSVRPACLI